MLTAQEWLETAAKVVADCDRSKLSFQIVCNAATIIREQQNWIERLERAVEEGNVSARILKGLQDNLDICFEGKGVNRITELQAEITRLTAELKEREGEVGRIRKTYDSQMDILRKRVESLLLDKEFLTSNVNHAESLAAARLADQEAIERHVTKRVARECYQIACGCEFGYTAAKTIREKYGVG